MGIRGIKVKEGEDLSQSNVERVIKALETDSPITKKEACQMLNIAYNTARLDKIIAEHKNKLDFIVMRKAQLRNQPVDNTDKQRIVQDYLSKSSIAEISDSVFRSANVVKNILKSYNIPIRNKAYNYFDPVFLEDNSYAEDYQKGDLVFSARYNSPAYIEKLIQVSETHGSVYRIWILGPDAQFAAQPYYELADLRKLQTELNIKIHELDNTEIMQLLYEALQKAKRLKKDTSND